MKEFDQAVQFDSCWDVAVTAVFPTTESDLYHHPKRLACTLLTPGYADLNFP